jgi:hypothetical protein
VVNGITRDEIGDRYSHAYRYDYGYDPGEGMEPVPVPGDVASARPELTHEVVAR